MLFINYHLALLIVASLGMIGSVVALGASVLLALARHYHPLRYAKLPSIALGLSTLIWILGVLFYVYKSGWSSLG